MRNDNVIQMNGGSDDLVAYYDIPGVDTSPWAYVGAPGKWQGNEGVPAAYTQRLRTLALRITGMGSK